MKKVKMVLNMLNKLTIDTFKLVEEERGELQIGSREYQISEITPGLQIQLYHIIEKDKCQSNL